MYLTIQRTDPNLVPFKESAFDILNIKYRSWSYLKKIKFNVDLSVFHVPQSAFKVAPRCYIDFMSQRPMKLMLVVLCMSWIINVDRI